MYETEPNDTPAEANAIAGEVTVFGTMLDGDQDGFFWTVSDEDARKRWTLELQGVPGRLTIAEIVRIEFAENGVDVAGFDRLMKMGTRDGLTPSVAPDLIFEPGSYLVGIAYAGGAGGRGGGMFRPPAVNLSFGQDGAPKGAAPATAESDPGSYRFMIREGKRLAVSKDPGPRATRDEAFAMRLGREFATFESRDRAWYEFPFTEDASSQRWDINVQVPVGREVDARFVGPGGQDLASAASDGRGRLTFRDLAPAPGPHYLELLQGGDAGMLQAISSASVGARVEGEEAEPNGKWELANRVDLSTPLTARVSSDNEWDYFLFSLNESQTDALLALRLEATPAQSLEFCLLAEDGTRLQCRRAQAPIELPDLLLSPGNWGLSVTRAREGMEYSISLNSQGPVAEGREAEPNDTVKLASGVPVNNRIKGRLQGDEADYFRFFVTESPQLWRFQVIGDGLREVTYHDGSGAQVARVRPARGQRRARLENLFLLPGQHFIGVSGESGDYTVLARPLGPPDPDSEREPNDDASRMQRLAVGQTRHGVIADPDDSDYYRFFLSNRDHVRLSVEPPADASLQAALHWYGKPLAAARPRAPGEPLVIEGLFPPGDYHVALTAGKVSAAEYRVSLERLPRFSCAIDCEPNGMGSLYLAAPLPPDGLIEGNAGVWNDSDVYQLPSVAQPTELEITSLLPAPALWIGREWSGSTALKANPEDGTYHYTLPAGGVHRLYIQSKGQDYKLQLRVDGQPAAESVAEDPPAKLSLALDTDRVSAYRSRAQKVRGQVQVINPGAEPLAIHLDAVTSDYRWEATLQQRDLTLAPGESADVPLEVLVPPDAWADRPVRISVSATSEDNATAEVWQELAVDRDIPPVNPQLGWQIPESLRGGFNVAAAALGGGLHGDHPGSVGLNFEALIDGKSVLGNGMSIRGWDGRDPRAVTIKLAGSGPVPVAGIALNHFGSPSIFTDVRKATLLLSDDGTNFAEALRFETLPVKTEQYFPLTQPINARYARLRFDATFSEKAGNSITLGEWKVIARPGYDPFGGAPPNIADPARGGHVVWASPPVSTDWDNSILTAADDDSSLRLRPGQRLEWVVGFHHNRAARIAGLEWRESPSAKAEGRFDRVTVSASQHSPTGPWEHVADWSLDPAQVVHELALEKPVWARFLRFSAPAPATLQWRYAPDTLRVRESPSDNGYRSILAEWGHASRAAWYELSRGPDGERAVQAAGKHQSRDSAAELAIGNTVAGQVELGKYAHWYRFGIPQGQNSLAIELGGEPTVRTVLELQDSAGKAIVLRPSINETSPARHVFEAVVDPGATYLLKVEEPPRNVVFSWDTSPSVNAYLPTIYNSLAAFSSQVVPGREAVNLAPFGRGPLLQNWHGEPYVLQTILNDYPRSESSSDAERTLKKVTTALAKRAGAKAIVLVTDAATNRDASMWDVMKNVQPRIFSIGVAGTRDADREQDRLQDWSSIGGGHYQHLVYEGELEVAFDRAATLMRRPAGYTLTVATKYQEAPGPGSLRLVSGEGKGSKAALPAVELILDASGSMLQRMDGKRRIAIAKEVLKEAVTQHIPAGTLVALRVFGHKEPNACRSDLEIAAGPLVPEEAVRVIDGIEAMNLARTPIADSLTAAQQDLSDVAGQPTIVLVTDGEETCEGDPAKVIESLQSQGLQINLNIVGFAINQPELEEQFRSWAELGGGRYFPAADQAGLGAALRDALRIAYSVLDADGNVVAEGLVDGEALELRQGIYHVDISSPVGIQFENVNIAGDQEVVLTVE